LQVTVIVDDYAHANCSTFFIYFFSTLKIISLLLFTFSDFA